MELKNAIFNFFFTLICVCILVGCKHSPADVRTPIEEQYAEVEFNKDIELTRIKKGWDKDIQNSEKEIAYFGDDIDFDLVNHSNNKIQYDWEGVVFAFFSKSNEWVKVQNIGTFISEGKQIIMPKDDPDYIPGFITICPSVAKMIETNKLIPIRVVVIGTIINGNGESPGNVGAFYDLYYKPLNYDG